MFPRVFRLVTLVACGLGAGWTISCAAEPTDAHRYVVQAGNAAAAREAVQKVGGAVLVDLNIIHAVGATLSREQADTLRHAGNIRVYADVGLAVAGHSSKSSSKTAATSAAPAPVPAAAQATAQATDSSTCTATTDYVRPSSLDQQLSLDQIQRSLQSVPYYQPGLVGAPDVHKTGVYGKGVTVAVVDTGLWWESDKLLAKAPKFRYDSTSSPQKDDPNGHGTHLSSIIASNRLASNLVWEGIAPGADIAAVRAFRCNGSSTYIDVIAAIEYVIAHKTEQNIRVLNLSFSAPPQSYYWDDPLNQSVMAAWQAGIVVVAAAGNDGPAPMTIGVPGNVPYIITVGAMTDANTPANPTDDHLASFSSTGPTFEGFIKPEVLAPGGHVNGSMPFDGYIAASHSDAMLDTQRQFKMSGTSQATAVVSGVVALMLSKDPTLTPDDVKCRLMDSAHPAVDASGHLAYSVFQQGAGLINAVDAVNSTATKCANQGLNLADDMAGRQHFGGPANQDASGNYYVTDGSGGALSSDGFLWSRGYAWNAGYVWSDGYVWSRGLLWSRGFLWSRGYFWSRSISWTAGQLFSSGLTESMSISPWVTQE
jgi:serine protease AprX